MALCPTLCPPAILRAVSCRSAGLTMLYRSKTERVLCPVILMLTTSGTPERIRFRAAVRRKSCRSIPDSPAALHALRLKLCRQCGKYLAAVKDRREIFVRERRVRMISTPARKGAATPSATPTATPAAAQLSYVIGSPLFLVSPRIS